MAQITYADKVALNVNPEIAAINKVQDTDMNEIKQVVNDNYNNTIQITDTEPTDSDNKIWIDTGEIAQAHTEITNEYSTSTGLGYSANYVNNLHTYSTTEQRIGTWIDGKPLYKRTFDISNITSSNTNLVNLYSYNIDNIIKISGFVKASDGYILPMSLTDSSSNYAVILYNGTYLRGRCTFGSGGTVTSAYVTIEYTKTTD